VEAAPVNGEMHTRRSELTGGATASETRSLSVYDHGADFVAAPGGDPDGRQQGCGAG